MKESALLAALTDLVDYHRRHCAGYRNLLGALGHAPGHHYDELADLPWLPVRLFKHHDLRSVPDDEVVTVVSSSGTTGAVSRIAIDRPASIAQQRSLVHALRPVLDGSRLPLLVVEARSVLADPANLSARAAGVLGLLAYGRDVTFALDHTGRVDLIAVRRFLEHAGGDRFLIFGFTYLVWSQLYPAAVDHGLDLSGATLLHSGGWKNMAAVGVDDAEFRRRLSAVGVTRIHNFYGMAEQVGTVFLQGSRTGHLHCPDFADVIVRDPQTWREAPIGTTGVIEVLSTVPRSHPGHVLLTEDLGVVHGVDDGDWPGKHFSVLGRVPGVEVRGCGDVRLRSARGNHDRRHRQI